MIIPLIFIILGVILLGLSLFLPTKSTFANDQIEEISISVHKEMNGLRKRIKALEEELLITTTPPRVLQEMTKQKKQPKRKQATSATPVHAIIVSQIIALHKQGYSTAEIAKRSSLPERDVIEVLVAEGVKK